MALLKGTGWTDTAQSLFSSIGGLAAGVKNYVSGRTKENRDAIKQEQAEQSQAIADYQLGEQKTETAKLKMAAFFNTYGLWIGIGLGVLVLIFVLWKFVFKKRGRSYRSAPRKIKIRMKSRSKTTGKRKSSSGGFRRRIGNTVYTSAQSWSRAMRARRKK